MDSLTKRQKSLLTGMLLGDGCLSLSNGANAFLRIQHSEKQLDYLKDKEKEIKDFASTNVYLIAATDKKHPNDNYALKTTRKKPLTELYHLVYPDGKKQVKREWVEWIDLEGLAMWYQDDGSCTVSKRVNSRGYEEYYRREVRLHTNGFTKEENEILAKILNEKFGYEVKVKKLTSKVWGVSYNLKIMTHSANIMFEQIRPFVSDCMKYKLDMKYGIRP